MWHYAVEEAVLYSPTVSCDKAMSAVTALLHWAVKRGVKIKNVLVLKYLQENKITEYLKEKPQYTLDEYFKK